MVDGVASTKLDVNPGIPQGFVLEPLLFVIYVNIIINSSNLLTIPFFADDAVVLYSHKSIFTLASTNNKEIQILNDSD